MLPLAEIQKSLTRGFVSLDNLLLQAGSIVLDSSFKTLTCRVGTLRAGDFGCRGDCFGNNGI